MTQSRISSELTQPNGNSYLTNGAASTVSITRYREIAAQMQSLRDENTLMRKQLQQNGWAVRISDQAYRDSLLLAAEILADMDASRQTMQDAHGLSRRRWEWARALMRLAGIADTYNRLTEFDGATVETKLRKARDRAADNLTQLKRFLPRGRYRELS